MRIEEEIIKHPENFERLTSKNYNGGYQFDIYWESLHSNIPNIYRYKAIIIQNKWNHMIFDDTVFIVSFLDGEFCYNEIIRRIKNCNSSISKEPKKMTVSDICDELGYEIEIIK